MTLTGPGGTGKTRLSLQVAADLVDDFEDGVFFVELAPISDPALVPATIAQVLGVRDVGGRPILESLQGAPAAPSRCCWCSTTSSRSCRPRRAWPTCWRPAPASRCWSPAANRSTCAASASTPCRRWPARRATPSRRASELATVRRGGAVRRAGRGDPDRFRRHRRERAGRGRDLRAPGWPAARHRAGRCPGPAADAPGDAGPAGAPTAAAHPGCARPPGPPADPARHDRLELRPADAERAGAVPPPGDLRRRVHASNPPKPPRPPTSATTAGA